LRPGPGHDCVCDLESQKKRAVHGKSSYAEPELVLKVTRTSDLGSCTDPVDSRTNESGGGNLERYGSSAS
jgi:hypothetical protein